MALPTTISGYGLETAASSYADSYGGPFISSGGNVYVVGSASQGIQVYKATDPTSSFAEQDTANNPTWSGGGAAFWTVQEGDTLHIAWQEEASFELNYVTFDMSTDSYAGETTIESDAGENISGVDRDVFCCIDVRSDGDILVIYSDVPEFMGRGGTWTRIALARNTGAGWTAGIDPTGGNQSGASNNFTQGQIAVERHLGSPSDRAAILFHKDNLKRYSLYNASNSFDQSDLSVDATNSNYTVGLAAWDDGGTGQFVAAWADTAHDTNTSYRDDGSGSGTWSSPTELSTHIDDGQNNQAFVVRGDDGEIYLAYIDDDDSDIDYRLWTGSGTDDWGSVQAAFASISASWLQANVYTRDSSRVLAVVYYDSSGGNWVYDEYEIEAVGGGGVDVTPAAASVTVTGYAPTAANNTSVDVTPASASVTVSGFAPTVDIPFDATPASATVTVTGYAPTVENNLSVDVTPASASITMTGFAPTVANNQSVDVTPASASLTITGFAPTAADNLSVDVTPDAASLTVTGYAPTATAGQSADVTPDSASITVSGFAPTVTAGQSVDVTPDPASVILAGFAPTVTAVSDQPSPQPVPKGPGPGGGFLPDTMRAIERGIRKTGKRRKKDRDELRRLLREAIKGAEAEGVDLAPVVEIAREVEPVKRALPNLAITLDFSRVERALEAVSAAIRADLEAQETQRAVMAAQDEEDALVALLMTM